MCTDMSLGSDIDSINIEHLEEKVDYSLSYDFKLFCLSAK